MQPLYLLCCPCHFGLERTLRFEISKIGGTDITAQDGRVLFRGDALTIAKANLSLSVAERVLIQLGQFPAYSFEELFQGMRSIPLEQWIGKDDAFPVKGHALDSKLHSVPDCQSILKKAAVERLKSVYHTSWFTESGAIHPLHFTIRKNIATIYLDTSGIGLHKRGYRKNANAAPIKETLAAGIVDLARVHSDSVVCDPFCGSGTILIEAAFKALRIAPGMHRRFLAEKWAQIPESVWKEARSEAVARIQRDATFTAIGSDIDERSPSPRRTAAVPVSSRASGWYSRMWRSSSRQRVPSPSAIRPMASVCWTSSRHSPSTALWGMSFQQTKLTPATSLRRMQTSSCTSANRQIRNESSITA